MYHLVSGTEGKTILINIININGLFYYWNTIHFITGTHTPWCWVTSDDMTLMSCCLVLWVIAFTAASQGLLDHENAHKSDAVVSPVKMATIFETKNATKKSRR